MPFGFLHFNRALAFLLVKTLKQDISNNLLIPPQKTEISQVFSNLTSYDSTIKTCSTNDLGIKTTTTTKSTGNNILIIWRVRLMRYYLGRSFHLWAVYILSGSCTQSCQLCFGRNGHSHHCLPNTHQYLQRMNSKDLVHDSKNVVCDSNSVAQGRNTGIYSDPQGGCCPCQEPGWSDVPSQTYLTRLTRTAMGWAVQQIEVFLSELEPTDDPSWGSLVLGNIQGSFSVDGGLCLTADFNLRRTWLILPCIGTIKT